MALSRPTAKFFEGRTPPQGIPLMSSDNLDWYAEQLDRARNGFSFRGDRFTGDQWWFYNFFPMQVALKDKHGNMTNDFDVDWPYWCQTDDWMFKQIEEADQAGMDVMIAGGRGTGKSYVILSIGSKIFYLVKNSHGVISASNDSHAAETWNKFRDSITATNKAHPTLKLDLILDNDKKIQSGDKILVDGSWRTENRSLMEKILYDKKPGISKGRRLNFQHIEEFLDWSGAAPLNECYAASKGTWHVGSIKKARVFYSGTGGTATSDQGKELFMNPLAYGIYPVSEYKGRKVALFIPAPIKYGGFYEDGPSDVEGATIAINKMRDEASLSPDPVVYNKICQEYPFTIDEMFMKKGGNRFNMKKILHNITILENDVSKRVGKWCNLHWRTKDKKVVGVDIEENENGKIWILEDPVINKERGIVEPRLYVGGYDGIDIGSDDSSSGKGSSGAISIKKRMLPGSGIGNIYVCHYWDRPKDVDELYDNCAKIMVLFGAVTNMEFSKVGIIAHMKQLKLLSYLMKRPKITLGNVESEKDSNLIGTLPTDKNFEFGENFLVKYTNDYGEQLLCLPVLEDLRDFTMDNRGFHDITVSMMMCEIGDDELMDKTIGFPKRQYENEDEYGFYTDEKGKKQFGKIPDANKKRMGFHYEKDQQIPDMYDYKGDPIYFKPGYGLNTGT